MMYHFNKWMSYNWTRLIAMVEENYVAKENQDDILCFGLHFWQTADQLKKQLEDDYKRKFRKLIIYQSEPLVENLGKRTEQLINNIRTADEIWEFDLENAIKLRDLGLTNVKFKPPLITNSLNRIKTVENPDIDILFFGHFSDYRNKLMRDLFEGFAMYSDEDISLFQKTNFIWAWNIEANQLDNYIARSKIILNLHPYQGESLQQTVRMFYVLSNNKQVVSEARGINYFGDTIHQFYDNQSFGNVILNLLRDDNWRKLGQNYNKHFLNKHTRSNTAIFYDVTDTDKYLDQIWKLQVSGLFDKADYIHINSRLPLPASFDRINNVTLNSNIDKHISDFKFFNDEYKIVKVTDSDIIEN